MLLDIIIAWLKSMERDNQFIKYFTEIIDSCDDWTSKETAGQIRLLIAATKTAKYHGIDISRMDN